MTDAKIRAAAEDLARELERDAADERGVLEGGLYALYMTRQAKNEATREDERLSPKYRQWLQLNYGERLQDGEHRIEAYLTDTKRTEWDVRPLDDKEILALARAGMLTVKTELFDKTRRDAPNVLWDGIQKRPGVRIEGGGTSLQVRPY